MQVSYVISAFFLLLQWCCALSYEEAIAMSSSDGLLHITDKNFRQLVKNDDFGLVLFLTADDSRVGCTLCHEFGPKYKAMAYQYMERLKSGDSDMLNPIDSKDDKSRIIFAFSDFMDARKYFELLGLTAVPRLFYYNPGKGPQMATFSDEYSFLAVENTDSFSRWLVQHVPGLELKYLDLVAPQTKSMAVTSIVFLVIAAAVFYSFKSAILKIAKNKALWEFSSICLIILFISGYMYNQIRNTEVYRQDKNGNIVYFAPGHNQQFGAETQIISIVYALFTISLFALISYLPKFSNTHLRLVFTVVACTVSFFLYSYLVEAYRIKSPHYPFHLYSALMRK